jgi:UDP-N-acetylmuramoyl-L-alanyl-D-glutamate--2,6-diaminopimelate ligase
MTIQIDSRLVRQGDVFIAIIYNHDHINQAVALGAKTIYIDQSYQQQALATFTALQLTKIEFVADIKALLTHKLSTYYHNTPAKLSAITGTNGKTSVAWYVHHILEYYQLTSAYIGTIGVRSNSLRQESALTTNDVLTNYKLLSQLADAGVDYACMEASSHGLAQDRLAGLKFQVGGITNISHDHLDYHHSMAEYIATKSQLFQQCEVMIYNSDDSYYDQIIDLVKYEHSKQDHIITIGKHKTAYQHYQLNKHHFNSDDSSCPCRAEIISPDNEIIDVKLPFITIFQIYNVMFASIMVSVLTNNKVSFKQAISCIQHLPQVRGRMELTPVPSLNSMIIVDYAHTPDALENVLINLRSIGSYDKVTTIVGCGGNRDKGKRPLMGGIAAKYSDQVIITDDNPRNESPAQIRAEIIAGIKIADIRAEMVSNIADRKHAIATAINNITSNECILIAGKGHETENITANGTITHHDDSNEVKKCLTTTNIS